MGMHNQKLSYDRMKKNTMAAITSSQRFKGILVLPYNRVIIIYVQLNEVGLFHIHIGSKK